jgi:uncharacterized membrane protein YccC
VDRLIGIVAGLVVAAVLLPAITSLAQAVMPVLLMLLVFLVGFRWLLSWLGF